MPTAGTAIQQSPLNKALGKELYARLQINPASDLSGDYANEVNAILSMLIKISQGVQAGSSREKLESALKSLGENIPKIQTYTEYVNSELCPLAQKLGATAIKAEDFITANSAAVTRLDQSAEKARSSVSETQLGLTLDYEKLIGALKEIFRMPLLKQESAALSCALNPPNHDELVAFFRKHTLT